MPDSIYTIGHSNHSIEKFIELLNGHEITAVADVRSHPFSRFNPQFNQQSLRDELARTKLGYVFLGRELGARTDDPDCYADGQVVYDRLARTTPFQQGLARLTRGAASHRIALMCAEKDPLTCHRGILICRHLAALGIGALHIREDGRIETHDAALGRLLRELGMPESDLFRSRDDLIADAYDERGKEIAYLREPPA